MSSTTLYGIKNCDSVKKARKWLEQNGCEYRFHDFREDGLDDRQLAQWAKQAGWETLLNRRSTTWKQLDPEVRENINSETALSAMQKNPTLIKRPVLEMGNQVEVGFQADKYQLLFDK